jgi:hypothetical protein
MVSIRLLVSGPVSSMRPSAYDTAGSEAIPEPGILRVVRMLWLILGVEVIQVPIELIEPVVRRKVRVLVPEMVLAELPCPVAKRLEHLRYRRILWLKSKI